MRIPSFNTDVAELAFSLVNFPSVSREEAPLVNQIEDIWRGYRHLQVTRVGNTLVASTNLGRAQRVIVAGHIDTVPIKDNGYARWIEEEGQPALWGRGSVDMKSSVAVLLHLSAILTAPKVDVTWVVYDCEEIEETANGLRKLITERPDLLAGDLAIIGEPTSGNIEAGCNGTLRVKVSTRGITCHSARAWVGKNAIHGAAPILTALATYQPETVEIDGLAYRECLNATWIEGGVARNSLPDSCVVTVNYRFAPNKTGAQALAEVECVFAGIPCNITVDDLAEGALPGLGSELGQRLSELAGGQVYPKYGWTDVARFTALGIPALNFGAGDPLRCHTDDEACEVSQIYRVCKVLKDFLS